MKRAIFIDGRRDGYHPNQCSNTMTVAELRSLLDNFNEEDEVFIINDNGYTYGSISPDSFSHGEYNSESVFIDGEEV